MGVLGFVPGFLAASWKATLNDSHGLGKLILANLDNRHALLPTVGQEGGDEATPGLLLWQTGSDVRPPLITRVGTPSPTSASAGAP